VPAIIKGLEQFVKRLYQVGVPAETTPQDLVRELLGVALAVRKRVRRGLIERGHDLQPSHTSVIPNLPAEGLRLTELAERLRVSVQRAGQLVQELVDAGYVERTHDERDARAKLVRYSARGRRLMADVAEVDAALWDELAATLGETKLAQLASAVHALYGELVGPDAPLLLEPGAAPARKKRLRARRR
jgi:DNA-binding MarR family transcriptional regulator